MIEPAAQILAVAGAGACAVHVKGVAVARPSIIDLIPRGFVCPTCNTPRPNPYQWGACAIGGVICRTCLSKQPDLQMGPLSTDVASGSSLKILVVSAGQVWRAKAGLCCVCNSARTRRVEGYCRACRLKKLVAAHGGYGAIRLDACGRAFIVSRYTESDVVPPPEALYPWGYELLPAYPTREATLAQYDEQQAKMWELVRENWEYVQRLALKYSGGTHDGSIDAAIDAACRAALTYDEHKSSATFQTYLYVSVRRALAGTRARRREAYLEEMGSAALNLEDPAARRELARRLGLVPDPVNEIESLGLTEFERRILTDWIVEGIKLEQIGRRYGRVKSTVAGWIHRAIKKAREAKAARDGDGERSHTNGSS